MRHSKGRKRKASGNTRERRTKSAGYCYCGKLIFETRRDAKAYARQKPQLGIQNVYVCNNYGAREKAPYHVTSISHEEWNQRREDDL